MKNKKYILTLVVAMGACYSVGAATGVRISALLTNQDMIVHGREVNKKVIMYNNTTYLPLRQIGEMLGTPVDYKGGKVILGELSDEEYGALVEKPVQNNAKVQYKKYRNPRFGFSISYPDFLTERSEADNGDGITLYSQDGEVELTVSGANNIMGETVASQYESDLSYVDNVLYQAQKGNWYVISSREGDYIYYTKCVVGECTMNRFEMRYPAAEKAKYEKIIKTLGDTFVTNVDDEEYK